MKILAYKTHGLQVQKNVIKESHVKKKESYVHVLLGLISRFTA